MKILIIVISLTLINNFAPVLAQDTVVKNGTNHTTKLANTLDSSNYKHKFTTKACFYANKFHGHKTASGELYNKYKFTAASKSLPFGSLVLVKNPHTGKSCLVRINDRGPFNKSLDLDLSQAAAYAIGLNGTSKVICHTNANNYSQKSPKPKLTIKKSKGN